jgi:GNAT superfamily N-acetyltransferase
VNGITVDIAVARREHDAQAVRDALIAYNRDHAGQQRYQELTIWLRDDQQTIVGGLLGSTYWGWLVIETLWVDVRFRGHGLGRLLLNTAEGEAVRRGCHHACLETFSFQAPAFYAKLGCVVFGVLDDYPGRHRRYSFRKDLVRS